MSHFVVYVLTKGKPLGDLEAHVSPLLAPFDENMDVAPYEEECYCVGLAAQEAVEKQVSEEVGTIDANRTTFYERHPRASGQYDEAEEEKIEKLWREEVVEPRHKRAAELVEQHPLKGKPDPKCDECDGTGKVQSTRNPNSKWDWYAIGGRWSGQFAEGYQPELDPRNWEDGVTTDQDAKLGVPAGKRVKWPTQWAPAPEGGDSTPISALLARDEKGFKEIIPFAIVTPDGVWHEKGRMGWFGHASDKKPQGEWHDEVRSLFEAWPDAWAINVDCHI